MLVHPSTTPRINFAVTYLYTWVKTRTVRVKGFAQEHNTVLPPRAQARNACSGVERVNHEATALKRKTRQLIHGRLLFQLFLGRAQITEMSLKKVKRIPVFCW